MHSAEKARDTTLDDENASQHVTSVLVTALSATTSHVTLLVYLYPYINSAINNSYKVLTGRAVDGGI